MNERADILSFGGGTQSTAVVELILQGKLTRPERIVMADTGREASETWDYATANVVPRLVARDRAWAGLPVIDPEADAEARAADTTRGGNPDE